MSQRQNRHLGRLQPPLHLDAAAAAGGLRNKAYMPKR